MLAWILGALVVAVAGIGFLQHRAQRGTYRSLASRQPQRRQSGKKPLGFEALDLDAVSRVTRRNESLERGSTNWSRRGSWLQNAADTDIAPLADDETYAARYFAAFQKDTPKD